MSQNITFNSDNNYESRSSRPSPQGGMIGWLIKRGLATSVGVANIELIIFFLLVVALTIYILVKFS